MRRVFEIDVHVLECTRCGERDQRNRAAIRVSEIPQYGFRLINVYPHDRTSFTLEYRDGFLYESSGLVGHSTLRKVKLETGAVQLICGRHEFHGLMNRETIRFYFLSRGRGR